MKNSHKSILIIEDIESNMKLLHDILQFCGCNILQAKTGMDGWRMACEHRPDLILMDIQLPDVSGLDVTRWLKDDETLKSIPIIAVTSFAMEGDEEKMLENGCDAYISKPISVPNFMHTVGRFAAEGEPNLAESELETVQAVN